MPSSSLIQHSDFRQRWDDLTKHEPFGIACGQQYKGYRWNGSKCCWIMKQIEPFCNQAPYLHCAPVSCVWWLRASLKMIPVTQRYTISCKDTPNCWISKILRYLCLACDRSRVGPNPKGPSQTPATMGWTMTKVELIRVIEIQTNVDC